MKVANYIPFIGLVRYTRENGSFSRDLKENKIRAYSKLSVHITNYLAAGAIILNYAIPWLIEPIIDNNPQTLEDIIAKEDTLTIQESERILKLCNE